MSNERDQDIQRDEDQPGTIAMNPGDEVPAGTPGAGENVCPICGGSGKIEGRSCATCSGTGVVIEAVGGA
jgi:hypothetical protein